MLTWTYFHFEPFALIGFFPYGHIYIYIYQYWIIVIENHTSLYGNPVGINWNYEHIGKQVILIPQTDLSVGVLTELD